MMRAPAVRPPAVAGQFYPAEPELLLRDIERYVGAALSRPVRISPEVPQASPAIACVVPHAGYMYSGPVAGAVYAGVPARSTYIIMGPNHFGRGSPLATVTNGAWMTPLGAVPIDGAMAQALIDACPSLAEDAYAHSTEHSLEVQVPFLQQRFRDFSIVPVAVAGMGWEDYDSIEALGHAAARVMRNSPLPVMLVASTDLNHYEPDSITREKDQHAIQAIEALDPEQLLRTVQQHRITMCGCAATAATLVAVRDLGAKNAQLVKYATSADTSGDRTAVVGYAGLLIS
jgi:AmmeMemoRadiSam system protein B